MTSITIILGSLPAIGSRGGKTEGEKDKSEGSGNEDKTHKVHFKTGFTDSDPETTEEYELEVITHRKLQLTL